MFLETAPEYYFSSGRKHVDNNERFELLVKSLTSRAKRLVNQ